MTSLTELQLAASQGQVAKVQQLLKSGESVNKADDMVGKTALMFAAAYGHLEIMNLLLEHGADPNLRVLGRKKGRRSLEECERRVPDEEMPDDLGQTALIWAITSGMSVEVMRRLIEAGASPNLADIYRRAPLMHAARWGRADVVRLLIEAGAEIDQRDVFGYSALMHASKATAEEGAPEVVEVLRAAGADDKGWQDMELVGAVWELDLGRARAALEHGAQVSFLTDKGSAPLHGAVITRHRNPDLAIEIIRYLLEQGADPDRCRLPKEPPLFYAIEKGDIEVVKLLLRHGANPSRRWGDFTALDYAKGCRQREILNILKEAGAPKRDWSKERGLPARDGEMAAVLVRQGIEAVSTALAHRGELLRGIQGQEVTCGKGSLLIYQLAGHPWTVIETAADDFLGPELAVDLSRSLGSPAIWIGVSDASSAVGFDLFEAGERTEWFYDGPGRKGKDSWERDFGSKEKKRKPSKNADPQEVVHKFLISQDAFYMGPQGGVAGRPQVFFSGWSDQELVRADVVLAQ